MELHASGSRVPNTIMLINGEDVPICHRLHGCKVPVFTLFKRLSTDFEEGQKGSSDGKRLSTEREEARKGGSDGKAPLSADQGFADREVLLPNFSQVWDRLYMYPWEGKINAALLRASLQVRVIVLLRGLYDYV